MSTLFKGILLAGSLVLSACGGEGVPAYSPEALQQLQQAAAAYTGQDAAQLQQDAAALALGAELFAAHCASCHGSDGKGRLRIPDLAAGVFDYGADAASIRHTITAGRHSVMPRFGHLLGEFELGVMAAYVKSFSDGEPLDPLYLDTAQKRYAEHCVACHGPELRGNPALGASDLTDASWQFAGSVNGVRMTMTGGTESQCPPQGAVLSAAEIELLTAHVLALRAVR